MKKRCLAVLCASFLLTGCSLLDEEYSEPPSIYETQSTTAATYTEPDPESVLSSFSYSSRVQTDDWYTERETVPAETETTAETTAESAAETTAPEDTAADTTAQTTDPDAAETTTTVTTPAGPRTYRMSGVGGVRLTCSTDPMQYCSEEDGETVFDLGAAAAASGFRQEGAGYSLTADGRTAVLTLGSAHTDAASGKEYLAEILADCGGHAVMINQEAPRKAEYRLPNGLYVTEDQLVLFVYLTEQLAEDPASDPLAYQFPSYLTDTVNGTANYYLP